ncbi:MAG: AarF/UbiB family protein, partial [Thermoanaerobaculia bacterium]
MATALSGRASRGLRRRSGTDLPGEWGSRLRQRLIAAGPLAARFGIHLGSRVDLFSGTDCLALLEIPDQGPPSHPAKVADLLSRELQARPDELFAALDPEPFDSGLVFQWHRARLAEGNDVVVELVHPELLSDLESGALRPIVERLVAAGELPAAARDAVGDLERQLDRLATCDELEKLADETEDSRWIEVPRAHRRFCTQRIRVLADLDGEAAEAAGDREDRKTRENRARRLARAWLALALSGRVYPSEPWGRNVRYLPSGKVAFLGGGIGRLPRTAQGDLRDYLAAVAAKNPALAALTFLDLLPDVPAGRRLRDRLRHTDPFRDRGWDVGGDLFARQVLAHRRTASELGYDLPEDLAPFYRGLFLLNQEVRALAGDRPVGKLLQQRREARLLLLFGELREEVESGHWSGTLERQLSLVSGLPQKLDRILTLAAEDDRDENAGGRSTAAGDSSRGSAWPA